jgi:PKHD-type hydroxylase
MLLTIDDVLLPAELQRAQALLDQARWTGGAHTAGIQAAAVKNNEQLDEGGPHLHELRRLVLDALNRSAPFLSAVLPHRILPPFFNRYGGASNAYGRHVDGAIRQSPDGTALRADVSATLFLTDPEDYEGGVLTIVDTFGAHGIKLKAGSLVVYPSSSVHEVTPVTRGHRVACFMFIESLVREPTRRRLLYDMDMALVRLREAHGEIGPLVELTGVYHNLLRGWAGR